MRVLAYVLGGVLGGMGVMAFFYEVGSPTSNLSTVSYAMPSPKAEPVMPVMEEPKPWTGEDLLEMAQLYDQQADELQSEAVRLEQRATSLAEKPHMDPKGFRRTSLMHVASSRWRAARELRDLAAMHRSEGQRLLALEEAEKNMKNN